jgi:hypothetical protein
LILDLAITLQHYLRQPIIVYQLLAVTFNLTSPFTFGGSSTSNLHLPHESTIPHPIPLYRILRA